jgi:hypothetical protein
MCLSLVGGIVIDKTLLGKPNSKGLYSGYKVFDNYAAVPNSIFYGHLWKRGWNNSSRICTYDRHIQANLITKEEQEKGRIWQGFHIFLNKKDAVETKNSRIHDLSVLICRKVYFKLDDVVATGGWDQHTTIKCAVVTKLFVRFD